jgi:hypothetical protein
VNTAIQTQTLSSLTDSSLHTRHSPFAVSVQTLYSLIYTSFLCLSWSLPLAAGWGCNTPIDVFSYCDILTQSGMPCCYRLEKSGTVCVTNWFLQDNGTKMFKTHESGANGIPNFDTRLFTNAFNSSPPPCPPLLPRVSSQLCSYSTQKPLPFGVQFFTLAIRLRISKITQLFWLVATPRQSRAAEHNTCMRKPTADQHATQGTYGHSALNPSYDISRIKSIVVCVFIVR